MGEVKSEAGTGSFRFKATRGLWTAVLVSVFPVISSFVSNQVELELGDIWRPLLGAAALGLVAALVLGLALRSVSGGVVLASLGVLSCFMYAPLFDGMEKAQGLLEEAMSFRTFAYGWAFVTLCPLIALIVLRRKNSRGERIGTRLLRLAGVLLLALFGLMILALAYQWDLLTPVTRWSTGARLGFWLILNIAGFLTVGRRRAWYAPLAVYVERVAWILLLVSTGTGAIQHFQLERRAGVMEGADGDVEWSGTQDLTGDTQGPDIFHFVLDAYDRPDILEENHGVAAEEILGQFKARDFEVAERATANYPLTEYSFAATFNFDYLQEFPALFGVRGDSLASVSRMRSRNRLLSMLKARGYRTYGFRTGFSVSEMEDIDRYLGNEGHRSQGFTRTLLELTPYPTMMMMVRGRERREFTDHRNRIYATFNAVPDLASEPSPKFVLVHVISPHQPFVLEADGEPYLRPGEQRLMTIPDGPEELERWRRDYARQVRGVNVLLFRALDELIERLERPTIILVQGDHGELAGIMDYRQKFGVLNAARFPGARPEGFTNDATLVNTYRIILNEYFGADLELLEPRSYWVDRRDDDLKYKDVTLEVSGAMPGDLSP